MKPMFLFYFMKIRLKCEKDEDENLASASRADENFSSPSAFLSEENFPILIYLFVQNPIFSLIFCQITQSLV